MYTYKKTCTTFVLSICLLKEKIAIYIQKKRKKSKKRQREK